MVFIDKNEKLIDILSGDLTLLSGSVQGLYFYVHDERELAIELTVGLLYDREKRAVKLKFSGIKEYLVYASHPSLFFYIEDYKFLKSDKGIYLSLEPLWENGLNGISSDDQNYILADEVEGYFLNQH